MNRMELKKLNISLNEKAALENAVASAEKNEALLEYVALMAGVDLPEETAAKEDDENV